METIKCENCETELDKVRDKKYCYTHEVSFCIWCAEIRDGHLDSTCRVQTDYPF